MKKVLLFTASVMALFFGGCSAKKNDSFNTTDRMGFEVSIPSEINSILSTAASNTEILVELGLADKIVGVDMYSEGIEGLGEDILYMDMYTALNLEEIIALDPDLVVASDINIRNGVNPFETLKDAGISVVFIPTAIKLTDIYDDIAFLAEITATQERGVEITEQMKLAVSDVTEKVSAVTQKKTVYFEISPSPYIISVGKNTFINDLINLAGGVNIFGQMTDNWPEPSEESIISLNPDVILTAVNYIDEPTNEISSRAGWQSINAIAAGKVFYIDADSVSRPTHNSIKALTEIAKALYPELYEN